jgi:hypothetical protein
MGPLNDFFHGYMAGTASGMAGQVPFSVLGYAVGLVLVIGTGACLALGGLWLVWRGGCRIAGIIRRIGS